MITCAIVKRVKIVTEWRVYFERMLLMELALVSLFASVAVSLRPLLLLLRSKLPRPRTNLLTHVLVMYMACRL